MYSVLACLPVSLYCTYNVLFVIFCFFVCLYFLLFIIFVVIIDIGYFFCREGVQVFFLLPFLITHVCSERDALTFWNLPWYFCLSAKIHNVEKGPICAIKKCPCGEWDLVKSDHNLDELLMVLESK